MSQEACQGQAKPVHLIALIVRAEDRIALVVHGSARWQAIPGYTLLPIEFPGATLEGDETPDRASTATALGMQTLGCPVRLIASHTVYGPSATRHIARLPIQPGEDPAPLLRVERIAPEERADGVTLRPVILRAYRAAAVGAVKPGSALAGVLWLPPGAMKRALRGLPFADLLALDGVRWQPNAGCALPENAFAYMPSEYGERFLLRALAKYGPDAVLQGENNGVGF